MLGSGGMGEVYRARDRRLDRTVAIKVLPPEFAADPARRQRLHIEARAISSVSHPHICAIHDIGHQDGLDFIVMEHLEGETLAERLRQGALPIDQALRTAIQIAGALAAAHERDVVHRDVKPGNVMLTRSGAKLVDFGLAKMGLTALRQDAATETDTEAPLTAAGTVLGTLPYMAPEQIEGRPADTRSDVFSLGTVLYEMLTGRRAFAADTGANLAAAILKEHPPPVSTFLPTVDDALDHVVSTCLAKDPDERWQSARDVELELRWWPRARHGCRRSDRGSGASGSGSQPPRFCWRSRELLRSDSSIARTFLSVRFVPFCQCLRIRSSSP